jgi:diguanylate cyclase (GGDEF)-like protein
MGGDEFLIIARQTNAEGGYRLAERIRQSVASSLIPLGHQAIHVAVTIGLAVASCGLATTPGALYEAAAAALGQAKQAGRNCIVRTAVGALP